MPPQNSASAAAPATSREEERRKALDQLFIITYEELRRLAATVKRGDPNITLSPTALVNEAFVKLAKSCRMQVESPLHFKRIAARAMRQLLVEAARRRNANKRGGEDTIFVTFDEGLGEQVAAESELLALDAALVELGHLEPRQAAIVEARFFGGLEVSEMSEVMGISEATILRDWRAAKAWLGHRLRHAG